MPRVVLSGYYGFNNTGDEAVLYGIVTALKKIDPEIDITVLSNAPLRTAEEYGVGAVDRWSIKEVVGAVKESDLVISGGGSLLQDVTGVKSICYYLGILLLGRLMGKPVMLYAQGIGPITTKIGEILTKFIIKKVDLITVRDEKSREELLKLKITGPQMRVTADPVLLLEPAAEEVKKGLKFICHMGLGGQLKKKKPVIGVSVREWPRCGHVKGAVARVCDDLVGRGWEVLFIPMHFPGDLRVSREIAGMMKSRSFIIGKQVDPPLVMGVVSYLNLVLGMRLHSLIFAAAAGVPSVGISYDPKVESFLNQVGQVNAGGVEYMDYERLRDSVFGAIDDIETLRGMLAERVPLLRQKAWENARIAVELAKRDRD